MSETACADWFHIILCSMLLVAMFWALKDKPPQQACGCFTKDFAHVCSQGITK